MKTANSTFQKIRFKTGLKQTAMAKVLGVSQSKISKMEMNKLPVHGADLGALLKLGATPSDIISLCEEEFGRWRNK